MQVFTTAQAIERFGRARVRTQVASGRWQRPERGVVVTHNGPIDAAQRQLVVLAASPPGSALSGLTALQADGFTGFEPEQIQLTVPWSSRVPDLPDVEAHQSMHLAHDLWIGGGPRRTTPARSVIDAASWCGNDRYARAIVIASLQQGLTCVRDIREALTRRRTQLRRGLVIESVLDASGGIQSLPERDFGECVRLAGLRPPQRQRPVRGKDGRFYLDAYLADVDVAVEIHGIPHLAVRRWSDDLFRANEIVIKGERLLLFSSYAVRRQKAAVVGQLERLQTRLAS